MGSQSQAMPSARRRSTMLYRRARSGLVLIAVFWLWMLIGAADFIASLFESPFHAALALYGLGALTLVSLLFLPICIAYLVLNRPVSTARNASMVQTAENAAHSDEAGHGLAPVIRMMPRRAVARGTDLTNRAAAKWRDLAS
ncbi:hypothetical protein [Arthrobacter zhangbolii]|uniref:Uncharacterized protein n=2 Tax=Arthrobacter zhangbolii TaxID=2886936 RepID=A0A9X1M7J5_9MICC|nr:hypothetical protein [Arthrobacter zhangbolii]MCC3272330.1 hypothetical protein [Arthrobacter zhangbolii]